VGPSTFSFPDIPRFGLARKCCQLRLSIEVSIEVYNRRAPRYYWCAEVYFSQSPVQAIRLSVARRMENQMESVSKVSVSKVNARREALLRLRSALAVTLMLFAASKVVIARGSSKETLGEFRAKYIGQRILILHAQVFDPAGPELRAILKDKAPAATLGGWDPAKLVGDRYETDSQADIPARYASQEPTVIAIQRAKTFEEARPARNALGEAADQDSIENPYVDVIVRFDDGKLAKITSYVSLLEAGENFQLVSVRDAHAAYLQGALAGVIGRSLYAVAGSVVFPIEATIQDLTALGFPKTQPLDDVPYLEPLRIAEALYNGSVDRVVLKLQLPDGRFGLAATPCDETRGPDVLSRISGGFHTGIPVGLTPEEVKAIQTHKIFRGMTRRAVTFSWGVPDKENDWGRGGKQLVYGEQFVYFDSYGVVTDWQSLGE
jgi:hypothetical protein